MYHQYGSIRATGAGTRAAGDRDRCRAGAAAAGLRGRRSGDARGRLLRAPTDRGAAPPSLRARAAVAQEDQSSPSFAGAGPGPADDGPLQEALGPFANGVMGHESEASPTASDAVSQREAAGDEYPCVVRFLHDDKECGRIIGKGGGRIKEIRAVSNASVQLTKGTSLYPGTKCACARLRRGRGADGHRQTRPRPGHRSATRPRQPTLSRPMSNKP